MELWLQGLNQSKDCLLPDQMSDSLDHIYEEFDIKHHCEHCGYPIKYRSVLCSAGLKCGCYPCLRICNGCFFNLDPSDLDENGKWNCGCSK